jgi:hypothetical protein
MERILLSKTPIIAATAIGEIDILKVPAVMGISVPPIPIVKMTAATSKFFIFLKSTWFSTIDLAPTAEIIPNNTIDIPPITEIGIEDKRAPSFGITLSNIANTAASS